MVAVMRVRGIERRASIIRRSAGGEFSRCRKNRHPAGKFFRKSAVSGNIADAARNAPQHRAPMRAMCSAHGWMCAMPAGAWPSAQRVAA
jgi:hypothetical protein